MNFYSHSGEDKWIAQNIALPPRGVMVEVGVGRWQQHSNSLHFEERGWEIILVEPNPELHAEISRNRTGRLFPCAAGNFDGVTDFTLHNEPTLSGINRPDGRKVRVPIRTLNSILNEAGIARIDVLSIDTEGTEMSVWNALNLDRHAPRVVILEYSTIGLPEDPFPIIERMNADGYNLVHAVGGNLIFKARA